MENKVEETENHNIKPVFNKMHLEHTFYHPLENVWEELKDIARWNKGNTLTKFELLKGKKPWNVGSQFIVYYKDYIPLVYKTLKYYEDDFVKQMTVECIDNPVLKLNYFIDYNLYKNTSKNSTVITIDLNSNSEIPNFVIDLIKFDFKRTFKLNNKYLVKNRKYEIEQVESCILKKNKNTIWKLLFSDSNNFSKLIPGLADEIIFKDEKLSLNSEFILKFNKENLEVPFRVSLIKMKKT